MSDSREHDFAARGAIAPELCVVLTLGKQRAQGMPGEGLTHGPPAIKNAGGRYHRFSQTSGIPCAMGLQLIRDLPGDRAFLPPSLRGSSPRNLTSASGGQDHTLLRPLQCRSSARTSRARRQSVHRIPRSTYRDDRPKRPSLVEAGRPHHASDSAKRQANFRKSKRNTATERHDGQQA